MSRDRLVCVRLYRVVPDRVGLCYIRTGRVGSCRVELGCVISGRVVPGRAGLCRVELERVGLCQVVSRWTDPRSRSPDPPQIYSDSSRAKKVKFLLMFVYINHLTLWPISKVAYFLYFLSFQIILIFSCFFSTKYYKFDFDVLNLATIKMGGWNVSNWTFQHHGASCRQGMVERNGYVIVVDSMLQNIAGECKSDTLWFLVWIQTVKLWHTNQPVQK